jgi:putative phosphonate metabolism protein
MNIENAYRYAIYYAPEVQSEWWAAGSQWLGRCAVTGHPLDQPVIEGLATGQLHALTQDPRRYGWHATLKAPFVLAPGEKLSSLIASLRRIAGQLSAFEMPRLQVTTEGGFLSLRPTAGHPLIQATANACVTGLHDLAQPLTAEDLARRRQKKLSPLQEHYLQTWFYPWVLDEFQFHMSLTGPLKRISAAELSALLSAARADFEALPPCRLTHLSVFAEPHPGADFIWVDSVALGL